MKDQNYHPSILHVARRISESFDFEVTPLKLQKLAYYCQAWSLVWRGRPMFEEDFQAWANGPVSPELYATHKGRYSLNKDFLSASAGFEFSNEDDRTMNAVLDFYGNKSPQFLSELSHKEQPWRLARGSTPMGESSKVVISKDSMQEYYTGIST